MPDWKAHLIAHARRTRVDHTQHVTVIEELAQHLDDRYRSLIAQGAAAADAEQSVLQELDDEALARELRFAERRTPAPALGAPPRGSLAAHGREDLRYAARALWHSPGSPWSR